MCAGPEIAMLIGAGAKLGGDIISAKSQKRPSQTGTVMRAGGDILDTIARLEQPATTPPFNPNAPDPGQPRRTKKWQDILMPLLISQGAMGATSPIFSILQSLNSE